MEHHIAIEQTLRSPLPSGVDREIIAELTKIAYGLRRAAEHSEIVEIQGALNECRSEIGAFISQREQHLSLRSDLKQALLDHREKIGRLATSTIPASELRLKTLAYHYLLEGIPSQIVAFIEERQMANGERPTRFQLLNAIIERRGVKSYLEIGCCADDCFTKVQCAQRVGVDPNSGGTLRMTSDQFFAVNVQKFDLIFIDGLHEAWQVDQDIINALNCLRPNGVIVMHDCNPLFDIRSLVPRASETWNGDVWKSFVGVRSRLDLDCAVGRFDHGCGVIIPRQNSAPIDPVPLNELVWDNLCKHRTHWLRPMELPQLLEWIGPSAS
jgi:predicted O-methyltransferase YrrM